MSSKPRTTRRELLRARTRGLSSGDTGHLLALLQLEQLAAEVYALALSSGHLSPGAARLARELGAEEQDHARALAGQLGRPAHTGRPETPATPEPERLEAALGRLKVNLRLRNLHGERAWFTALEHLESSLEGAQYEALAHLSSSAAATLVAQILASEAQHQTQLFLLRHPHDVSLAVSTGLVVGTAKPSP